jgi:hypothetical protein
LLLRPDHQNEGGPSGGRVFKDWCVVHGDKIQQTCPTAFESVQELRNYPDIFDWVVGGGIRSCSREKQDYSDKITRGEILCTSAPRLDAVVLSVQGFYIPLDRARRNI